MPTHPQQMVENIPSPWGTARDKGVADYQALQGMFPGSPIYSGDISNASLTEEFIEKQHGEVNDEGHTFGVFMLDYNEAPDVAAGPHGEGTDPPNPYVPNPTSPGPSCNAADKPDAPEGFGQKTSNTPGEGDGALTNPSNTSVIIAQQTLGTYSFGSSTNG